MNGIDIAISLSNQNSHQPMYYALSNVIIRDQKFLKVKHYFGLIFKGKPLNFFLGMKNCPIIEANLFSRTNSDRFWHFFGQKPKGLVRKT